jgi:hypothetical protein
VLRGRGGQDLDDENRLRHMLRASHRWRAGHR